MGLFRSSRDQPYSAIEISDEWIESGALTPSEEMQDAVYVMPHEDDGGIQTGTTFLEALHDTKTKSRGFLRGETNISPSISFEMKYSNQAMGFSFIPGSADLSNMIRSELGELYPDSEYEQRKPRLLDFQAGQYVSAARLTLDKYSLFPLKHVDLEGFNSDPLGSIAAQMIGLISDKIAPADVAVQVILKPATENWTNGIDGDGDIVDIAHDLRQPETRNKWGIINEPYEVNPSQSKKKAAKLVENQAGKQGWWLNIRVIAQSEDRDEAKRRTRKTAKMFERFYHSETEQSFSDEPQSGSEIRTCIEQAVRREYVDREMVKALDEAAAIAHIPGGDVNTRDLERSTVKGDQGIPPDTPQFTDFDQTGYSNGEVLRRSWEQFKNDEWDWPYTVRQDSANDFTTQNTHEWSITAREPGQEAGVHAGVYPRSMIENASLTDQPLWFGLDSNKQPVPVLENELFRHMFIAGQTGAGKSTAVLNILMQHAFADRGFCFVDPGGEDSFKLLRMLPEDRLDDIVFIDVTDERHDKTIGFNFLETFHTPDEAGFDSEVEGIVSDILPLLAADDHPRMKGVASNVLRALIKANHKDEDYTYAPIDLFYMLSGEEGRAEYAKYVREEKIDPLLEPYADKISQLEDSDLEPLVRRLKSWVESPKIRPLVSRRHSPMSIANAINDNRILIIKCDAESYDVREMVAATITRKIWSVITARPSRTEQFLMDEPGIDIPDALREASAGSGWDEPDYDPEDDGTSAEASADAGEVHIDDIDVYSRSEIEAHEHLLVTDNDRVQMTPEAKAELTNGGGSGQTTEHNPYFLTIDELHSVISDEAQIEKMLAEARKKRLGLILLTQQTHQLPDDQRRHVMSNCSTLLAFKPGAENKEKAAIASGFSGLTKDDLMIDKYQAWTTITNSKGNTSKPFLTALNPPYPPRRGLDGLRDVIERSIEEYGSERLTPEEIADSTNSRFQNNAAAINPEVLAQDGEASGAASPSAGTRVGGDSVGQVDPTSDHGRLALYKAIHIVQIRRDALNDPVHSDLVKNEWARQLSGSSDLSTLGFDSIPDNLIEEDPNIKRTRRSGDVHLTLRFEGLQAAGLTFDTGSSASGGKDHHRMVLKYAYYAFIKLGYNTWLPQQEGREEADGMADLPRNPSGAGNFREARQLEADLREELIEAVGTDVAVDLSDGRHVSIEAETSTMLAPEQTLTNLRKALDEDRLCVFACKDEHANDDRDNDTFFWPKRGEKIIYDTNRSGHENVTDYDTMTFCPEVDDEGNRTFYNRKNGYYKIGGEDDVFVLRKRSQAERDEGKSVQIVWKEVRTEDGEKQIILRDRGISDGEDGYRRQPQVHMRFEDVEAAANPERVDVEAYYGYDAQEGQYTVRYDGQTETYETEEELLKKWSRIYSPFIPEANFPRDPTPQDFLMIVFPDDDNPDYDEPMIYDQGDVRPLFPDELSMPEVPDVEDIEATTSESKTGQNGQAKEHDQEQGPGAFDQEGENSRVNDLVEVALELDGVTREQAVATAKQVEAMQIPWDMKKTQIKRLAPHWTGSTDGGIPADDTTTNAPSGHPDQEQRPQSQQGQNRDHDHDRPSQNEAATSDETNDSAASTDTHTSDRDGSSTSAPTNSDDARDEGESASKNEKESKSSPTFRDKLQKEISQEQASRPDGEQKSRAEAEAEDDEKAKTLAGIFERRGMDESEAKRKAEIQVYGEVRSDTNEAEPMNEDAIALPAADQSSQSADEQTTTKQPAPMNEQGSETEQERSEFQRSPSSEPESASTLPAPNSPSANGENNQPKSPDKDRSTMVDTSHSNDAAQQKHNQSPAKGEHENEAEPTEKNDPHPNTKSNNEDDEDEDEDERGDTDDTYDNPFF